MQKAKELFDFFWCVYTFLQKGQYIWWLGYVHLWLSLSVINNFQFSILLPHTASDVMSVTIDTR